MSISDRLNKLTTDITNAYTSIENKGGTIPANKNTNNLPTAIDSIEVIEQATAEGENLNLANTKAMPYSDYVVKGKSEQETRSGKNLWNNNNVISTTIITPNSNGGFKIQRVGDNRISAEYPINIPANTNITISRVLKNYSNNSTIYCQWIATDNSTIWTPNIYADTVTTSFNKDIKGIIFYLQQTASDGDYVEIEKLQIETGSTATSYEPYGASPSPEYPSEIHSVADDVNLLNRITCEEDKAFVWTTGATFSETNSLVSDYINVKVNQKLIFTYNAQILFYDSSKTYLGCLQEGGTTIAKSLGISTNSLTVPNINDIYYMRLGFRPVANNNQNMTSVNIKLQKGTVATPYSPYNQGTVTIKQRGKNLFDINDSEQGYYDFIIGNSITKVSNNANWRSKNLITSKANTQYVLSSSTTIGYLRIHEFDKNLIQVAMTQRTNSNNVFVTTKSNTKYIAISLNYNNSTMTKEIATSLNIQLEQGSFVTTYEPYQGNDYTFQTEPLRSLPNGVKDTIEAEQHRKIEYLVFDGSDDEGWGNYTLLSNNIVQVGKPLSKTAKSRIGLSNRFSVIADYSSTEHIVIAGELTAVYIHIDQTRFNTQDLAGFKEWLSKNPVILQYELAEEVIEPLTQNQATTMLDIIKTGSYEGTTNIYTDEDVKPTIWVGYYKKG